MEQRWRYKDRTGRPVWLGFKSDFLCIYCEKPIASLSCGGPAVCPTCDCGRNHDGSEWTMDDYARLSNNARRRLAEMPDDPAWKEYETSYAFQQGPRPPPSDRHTQER
jgi:hypothetical protein